MERVLVTGGAGFIGRHLARALLNRGYEVRVLDSLDRASPRIGRALDPVMKEVELVRADVRDADAVRRALLGVQKVVHLAAEVGVGQSMYAIDRYVAVNDQGTAVLFQELIDRPVGRDRRRLLDEHLRRGSVSRRPAGRRSKMRSVHRSAMHDGAGTLSTADGAPLAPVATPEWKRPASRPSMR